MARTYRRKQATPPFLKYWGETTEWHRDWYRKRHPGLSDDEIVRKKCVEYHSENHPGQWNPPSGFGKALNRKVKRDNRLNLIRCLRYDDEFVEIPLKRDSGHDYF